MKSSPKQTDYPIYSEGKLSERKQLFHLSLRNRLPALRQTPISESDTDSQNDERQALKRIVVFFAVMLILTLVARGTSSAIRPVVTTQQAKAGTISQSVQSSGSITASSVLSVSLPEGIVLDNILVKEGQSVVEGQTLAACDVDELSTKLDRAKASLQKSKAEYNQLLSNAVLDDTSVARTQQALLRAYEADQKAYEELEKLRASENPAPEAISTAEQAADDAHWAAQQAEYDRNSALASYQEMQRQNNLSAQVNQASAEDVALDIKDTQAEIEQLEQLVNQQGVMLSQISTLYEQTRYLSYISDIENISVRKQEEGTPLTEKIKSIRFENVSFHYPNSHNMVLKNFSYTFETGKTYALVGMNGSGKTTLIKLLMRLYTPINGHIYVNGVDIEEISFSSLQQQISAVFQDFIRYPFNVAENIAIHDADNINDFERVKEAAVHSEATEFIDALPLGYRTTLEKEWNGGTELSGGQWQKIAIARCFYKSSSVVILDEPFSAIDSFSEEQIIKSLASDTINKMCIFVTHRFNNICLADQILVLKDAQLIENGTHAQLMATNGLYARLYHAQADAFFTLSQSEVQEE